MRRDERLRRQEFDDGDPDDEVAVGKTNGGSGPTHYHDNGDCPRLRGYENGEVVTVTRAAAQQRWRAPCTKCTVDPEAVEDPPAA